MSTNKPQLLFHIPTNHVLMEDTPYNNIPKLSITTYALTKHYLSIQTPSK